MSGVCSALSAVGWALYQFHYNHYHLVLNTGFITLGQALAETGLKQGESGEGEALTNTSHSPVSGQRQELFTSK